MRRSQQRRAGSSERCFDSLLPGIELLHDDARRREREQPVIVTVACDLVAVRRQHADQLWMLASRSTKYEECGPMVARREQRADLGGVTRIGPVVEGEREPAVLDGEPRACDATEQRSVPVEGADEVSRGDTECARRPERSSYAPAVEHDAGRAELDAHADADRDGRAFVHGQAASRTRAWSSGCLPRRS